MSIELLFNGQRTHTELTNLADFIEAHAAAGSAFAVALNQNFVPRNQYTNTALTSGDSVELLSPMQGG